LSIIERRGEIEALFPSCRVEPDVWLEGSQLEETPTVEAAGEAAVRGHLASTGPIVESELALRTGIARPRVAEAVARLEARGLAVRGLFDPSLGPEQVCDRALLARIHRYTIARLRREMSPVAVADFLKFLVRWQHLHPDERTVGEGGLLQVVEQLGGFEAAAAAWEADLLPARVEGYRSEMLDRLCLSGQVAWGRLLAPSLEPGARPTRATPVSLFPRERMDALLHAATRGEPSELRGQARKVLQLLEEHGALFPAELRSGTGLLPVQVEDALRELVANGRVTSDGWGALRRLLGGRQRRSRPGRRRSSARRAGPEGRWGLLRPLGPAPDPDEVSEDFAWTLLRRYGVVFRDLLAREWLPGAWRDIHRALRRLEARGLVRGGRFVDGFVGEQFAVPEAVPLLRRARKETRNVEIEISACDPLNLAGIVTPGARVPATPERRVVLCGGIPVSVVERGRRTELQPTGELGFGS
ncbi:MAG: ATP-dependent DNA helicase, partial [Myxococcota bacterium]